MVFPFVRQMSNSSQTRKLNSFAMMGPPFFPHRFDAIRPVSRDGPAWRIRRAGKCHLANWNGLNRCDSLQTCKPIRAYGGIYNLICIVAIQENKWLSEMAFNAVVIVQSPFGGHPFHEYLWTDATTITTSWKYQINYKSNGFRIHFGCNAHVSHTWARDSPTICALNLLPNKCAHTARPFAGGATHRLRANIAQCTESRA